MPSAAEWDAVVPWLSELDICVNVSARQLTNPELVDVMAASLAETEIDPLRLCLEVTETVVIANAEASLEALTGLKHLEFTLAVDDFGAGYSSLS